MPGRWGETGTCTPVPWGPPETFPWFLGMSSFSISAFTKAEQKHGSQGCTGSAAQNEKGHSPGGLVLLLLGWSCSPGCICRAGGSPNKASGAAAQQDGLLQQEKGCNEQCDKVWPLAMPRVLFHCSWMPGSARGVRGELARLSVGGIAFHTGMF